jgi:hypothetical protein
MASQDKTSNIYTLEPIPLTYSSWSPGTEANTALLQQAKITSNWKYRQYLQRNASHIMEHNSMQTIDTSGVNPYSMVNADKASSSPYLFESSYDNRYPMVGMQTSDLKQAYIKKEQMSGRMIAPSISIA